MLLNKIVTLANKSTALMFTAMERSLRATGCDLPLYVIPYDDQRFELPKNAFWLEEPTLYNWIDSCCAHRMMRKYVVLTMTDYQYLDTDAVFLQNPASTLSAHTGFIASCTEWNKVKWTVSQTSEAILRDRSSTWQKEVFSAGQFACDRQLYTISELQQFAEAPENREACMKFPFHDQPGFNLFVLSTDVPRQNLTLPPVNMESTWAGDYDKLPSWNDLQKKPYLMHYAGGILYDENPLNEFFLQFFTAEECLQWEKHCAEHREKSNKSGRWPTGVRILNQLVKRTFPKYHVQPKQPF